jgi:hypothetical protein
MDEISYLVSDSANSEGNQYVTQKRLANQNPFGGMSACQVNKILGHW